MPFVNDAALRKSKRLLVVASLANAAVAATEEERQHHLEIAQMAGKCRDCNPPHLVLLEAVPAPFDIPPSPAFSGHNWCEIHRCTVPTATGARCPLPALKTVPWACGVHARANERSGRRA